MTADLPSGVDDGREHGESPGTWKLLIGDSFSSDGPAHIWTRSRAPGDELFPDHVAFVVALKNFGDPVGNERLRTRLQWAHRGRYRRVRGSLLSRGVIRASRGGRGLIGLADADAPVVFTDLLQPSPGRERALYAGLLPQVDVMLENVAANYLASAVDEDTDRVEVLDTSSDSAGVGTLTRPDLTAIVRLEIPHLQGWLDIHAIEVKPFWSLGRDGLFEAAAQAALQRCTHSWLLAYVPDESVSVGSDQAAHLALALETLSDLAPEALTLGIGLARARRLGTNAHLDVLHEPRRQVIDPQKMSQLLTSIEAFRV